MRARRRVLVEHRDDSVRQHLVTALRERGYDALGCGGPGEHADCPLLHHQPCPAAAQADAVVTGLATDPVGRTVVTRLHHGWRGRPLVVEGTPAMLAGLDPDLRDHHLFPLDVDRIVKALRHRP